MLDNAYELNAPPCIADVVEGDAVAIDLDSGVYYHLRGDTGTVFEALAAGVAPREVALAGGGEAAVEDFLRRAQADGLLRQRPGGPVPGTVAPWAGPLPYESYADMAALLALDPIHDVDETAGWPVARPGA